MPSSTTVRAAAALAVLALVFTSAAAAPPGDPARGRRLYFEGESGSGGRKPFRAIAIGGDAVPAAQLTCVSCHRADGRGGREAAALVPEIRWRRLDSPHGTTRRFGALRPPYDAALFSRALREGLDSSGAPLDVAMPRYEIGDEDVADLIAYLRVVGSEPEAGTTADAVRVGALLPIDGALGSRGRGVAALLERFFARVNAAGGVHGRRIDLVVRDSGDSASDALAAARALATGDSPVFACVGNGGRGGDRSVLDALASAGVPVIGPLSFAPEDVRRGPVYWILPSAESAARAAARDLFPPGAERRGAVAVFGSTSPAHAFADEAERRGARVSLRAPGETDDLSSFGAIALFTNAEAGSPILERVRSFAAPPEVVISSVLWEAPAPCGGGIAVRHVSPPVAPGLSSPGHGEFESLRDPAEAGAPPAAMEMVAFAAATLFVEGLKGAGRELTRDRLRVAIEGVSDLRTGVLPPIRYGPLRRDGTRGALIVAFDADGRLLRGDWVESIESKSDFP